MILERIIWPAASDSESDEEFDIGSKCSITGYLREYIQEGMPFFNTSYTNDF